MKPTKILALLAFIIMFSGCAVGPDYERPTLEVPQKWRLLNGEAASIVDKKWWEDFKDPVLNELISTALSENLDLKIATSRVDEFLARYGVSRAQYFPSLDLSGEYSRSRSSASTSNPLGGMIENQYSNSLVTGWEIDLWGRIRRLNESANAQVLAQESARRGVVLALVTSVAQNYVTLRQLDSKLQIAKETLKSRRASLDLVSKRFSAGDASELDVRQAEAELAATQVAVPAIESQLAMTENALSVLIGRNPQAINRGVAIGDLPLAREIPAGIPVDILDKRPDVIQSQEELRAANAEIGAARAEYFPKLSLTGMFGFNSNELSDWLRSPSRSWQFGPGVNMPIFNAGRVSSEVDAAKARKEQALQGYRKTIQRALQDVEDSLIGYQKAGEQREARKYQVSVLQRYVELALARYEAGASNYLDVLDAQRNLFNAQLEYADAQGAHVVALIQVYKALGGSWAE